MFRESDRPERVVHPSYSNKPVPVFQTLSQASKFDDTGVASYAYKENLNGQEIAAVPTSWDSYYDPNHPDADWTGLVSKNTNHRKHVEGHVSQNVGIKQTEHGIVSRIERQEWTHRRQPDDKRSKNDSNVFIAGINDDESRWQTTYNRFEGHEKTGRDQLTLEKRARPVRILPDPAQARSQRDQVSSSNNSIVSEQPEPFEPSHSSESLVGYRAPTFTKKSMISSLSSDIASRIDIPTPVSTVNRSNKTPDTLLTQNFNPTPGYTGRRKF